MAIGLFGPEVLQFSDGGSAAEVRIFVFLPGTKIKAVLYQDRNGLYTRANPLWTDRFGNIEFFIEEGTYDLYYEGSNYTTSITITTETSSSDVFVHFQGLGSTLWTIHHNLGVIPSVTVEESVGTDITYPAIRHPDNNTTELRWGYAASGRATLRR